MAPRPLGPAVPRRQITPKFAKPVEGHCFTCPAQHACTGYVPGVGDARRVKLLGESPAIDEQIHGEPFIGAAGSMLTRILKLIGKQREDFAIDNIVRGTLSGPIEAFPGAVAHCRYAEDAIAATPPAVIVPLGAAALRQTLSLTGKKGVRVQDFHGTVTQRTDGIYVVPSYHPSHLQRGAVNLMGTVAFDLLRAIEVAEQGWTPDPARVVLDPPIDWFEAWAASYLEAVAQDPYAYPLAVDTETPDKGADEGEILAKGEDHSYQILRVNLSVNDDEGITVPCEGPYLAILQRILSVAATRYFWFKGFDEPRLIKAALLSSELSHRVLNYDGMWMWKMLQSDLPMGIGFVAPFYSIHGAWKHLSETEPAKYAAIDGFQTRRVVGGITADLVAQGQWDAFYRHQHLFHLTTLQPATDLGVPIDRQRLLDFKAKLDVHAARLLDEIQACVPAGLRPLTPKAGLTRPPLATDVHTKGRATKKDGTAKKEAPDPLKMALYARAVVIEQLVLREVGICQTCGAEQVTKTHRCKDKALTPSFAKAVVSVPRWFWQEPFNPDSPDQLMAYVTAKGHAPGKSKQTGNPSVDRDTLSRLIRETGDPLYSATLDYRAVGKVRGTYVIGTEKRLDSHDRIHPIFSFKPSTQRLSCVNPNVQNVVADKGGTESLAAGFRHCVVAKDPDEVRRAPAVHPPSKILEFDFSGIEQVVMGWCMNDAQYIRIAKLGTHAIVASHELGAPANLSWPDEQLAAYLKSIKKSKEERVQQIYDRSKRCVHGIAYGLTVYGMCRNFPKTFPTLKAAEKIQDVYFAIAPGVPKFHAVVRHTAHEQHYVGGSATYQYLPDQMKVIGHPFAYKHWFWSVVAYERITESQRLWRVKRGMPTMEFNGIWYGVTLGEDAKRCVADYPQSISRGVLTEACFPLFDREDPLSDQCYIGDTYYDRTPLRAPIHDSLLMEVQGRHVDRVIERTALAMLRPVDALACPAAWGLGAALTIGVDGKIGDDWGTMEALALPMVNWGVASDVPTTPAEDDDEDQLLDLETLVRSA